MYSLLFFFQECNLENYLLFGICLRKRRYKQMGLRNIIFTVLWMTLDTQGSSGKVEYFLKYNISSEDSVFTPFPPDIAETSKKYVFLFIFIFKLFLFRRHNKYIMISFTQTALALRFDLHDYIITLGECLTNSIQQYKLSLFSIKKKAAKR